MYGFLLPCFFERNNNCDKSIQPIKSNNLLQSLLILFFSSSPLYYLVAFSYFFFFFFLPPFILLFITSFNREIYYKSIHFFHTLSLAHKSPQYLLERERERESHTRAHTHTFIYKCMYMREVLLNE